MALQVWLPLNGNLNNQGLSNVTVTNNGATVDNNGKIGKCYYFDGNDHIRISLPSELTTIKNTTVCAWVRSTGSVIALGGISNDTNYANAMVTLYTSGWQFSGSGAYKYLSSGLTANDGIWHHVACTIDDTTITTYKDGAKVTSGTLSSLGVAVTDTASANFIEIGCDHPGGDEYLTGYVNDFRIYDHALSPREIEILSRGLVCHYPLNNNGSGLPNLYDFESIASKWAQDGLTCTTATDNVYGNVLKASSSSTQSANYRIYREVSNVWNSGQTYTVSFLAKASKSATVKVSRSVADYAPNFTVGTTWKRYSGQINCTTTATGGTLSIQLATLSTDLYITQVKLELGNKMTAYQPGVGDSHYTPLGYGDTTEYDVSGNGYNGTKTQAMSYTSDTARYSVSTNFVNSSYIQTILPLPNGDGKQYTFSWWGKYTNYSGHMMWGYANGNRLNLYMASGNFYWNTGDGSNNPFGVSAATYGDNTWHHFAISGDGITTKLYIDGEFKANAKTYKGVTGTSLYFNGWDSSTSYNFNGSLSDFRLYATALSATQVAELYNTAVSVANNGALMGYELVEV